MASLPPGAGKSELTSNYFPAWWAGRFPGSRIILTSYESTFAESWSIKGRDTFREIGPALFNAGVKSDASRADRWTTTAGSTVHAVGAGGALTGLRADLIVLDDPIKGAAEYASRTQMDRLEEWFWTVLMTRLLKGGRVVIVGTRWGPNDLIGRLLEPRSKDAARWEHLKIPALNQEGVSYCPDLFPTRELLEKRASMPPHAWSGMYMCEPYEKSGGMFDVDALEVVDHGPTGAIRVRAWDLAASPSGDWTCGLRLARLPNSDDFWVEDVVRGRWRPGERDKVIQETVERDPKECLQVFEQEPGSAGVAQIDTLRELLIGHWVDSEKSSGDKITRAAPAASFSETRRIKLLRAPWNKALLEELAAFPHGRNDDQIDSLSLAFARIGIHGSISDVDAGEEGRDCECGRDPHENWCWDNFPEANEAPPSHGQAFRENLSRDMGPCGRPGARQDFFDRELGE